MGDTFDPYHKWLSIRLSEQPPNHYRLLGVELFEADADVIDISADWQMVLQRTMQTGPHAASSQRLLNEVAAARACLIDPTRRAAYDDELRARALERPIDGPEQLGGMREQTIVNRVTVPTTPAGEKPLSPPAERPSPAFRSPGSRGFSIAVPSARRRFGLSQPHRKTIKVWLRPTNSEGP